MLVLNKTANMPIPVLAPFNASTGNVRANTIIGQNYRNANTGTGTK
jgi:hypothetical protein